MMTLLNEHDLINLIKNNTCFKGESWCIDLILTNRKHSFKNSTSIETDLSDHFTEIAESAEYSENYNYLSSQIKQLKNYLSGYSDTLLQILSVKNQPSFFSRQCSFSFIALYVKTKTLNSRKVSQFFIYCISDEQCLQ